MRQKVVRGSKKKLSLHIDPIGGHTLSSYDFIFTKNTFTTPDTVVLGGYRTASGSLVKGYKGKVFYIRISEDGAYLKDWYPCQRLSDGVEGFWDCVSQTFIEPL